MIVYDGLEASAWMRGSDAEERVTIESGSDDAYVVSVSSIIPTLSSRVSNSGGAL